MANYLRQPNASVPEDWPCKCDSGCGCPPLNDIECFFESGDSTISLAPTLTYYPPSDPEPSDPYRWQYVDGFGNEVAVRCYNGQFDINVLVPPDLWEGFTYDITECGDLGGGFSGVRFFFPGSLGGLNFLIYWPTP